MHNHIVSIYIKDGRKITPQVHYSELSHIRHRDPPWPMGKLGSKNSKFGFISPSDTFPQISGPYSKFLPHLEFLHSISTFQTQIFGPKSFIYPSRPPQPPVMSTSKNSKITISSPKGTKYPNSNFALQICFTPSEEWLNKCGECWKFRRVLLLNVFIRNGERYWPRRWCVFKSEDP